MSRKRWMLNGVLFAGMTVSLFAYDRREQRFGGEMKFPAMAFGVLRSNESAFNGREIEDCSQLQPLVEKLSLHNSLG
jgi:hypothetical protein